MCQGVFWTHIPKLSLVSNLGFFVLSQDTFSGVICSSHLGSVLLFLPSDPIVVLLPKVDKVHLQALPQLHEPVAVDALCCFYRICTGTSITWGHTPAEQNRGLCCFLLCQYNPSLPTRPQWEQPRDMQMPALLHLPAEKGSPCFPEDPCFGLGR